MKRIVVGIDGSEISLDALRWAAREAELHHARLSAVLVWGLQQQQPEFDADDPYDQSSSSPRGHRP